MLNHGTCAAGAQAANTSRPPGLSAFAILAKAATGSSKNITPKRDIMASTDAGAKAWVCASAKTKLVFAKPAAAARLRARSSSWAAISTPVICPVAPTADAAAMQLAPVPQPMSSTASPGIRATRCRTCVSTGDSSASRSASRTIHCVPAPEAQNSACAVLASDISCSFAIRLRTC